jgi:voltage-gated potassium channel
MASPLPASAQPPSRRLVAVSLLRSLGITVILIVGYYLLPLDSLSGFSLSVVLTVALLLLATAMVFQVRATVGASYPALRAVQALATTVPLFLLLFSASYFVMSQAAWDNFNVHVLNRTDALYFTITNFSTVGFGDIVATSQTARILVTVQMVLDLVILGLVIRVFFGAVQLARRTSVTNEPGEQSSGM